MENSNKSPPPAAVKVNGIPLQIGLLEGETVRLTLEGALNTDATTGTRTLDHFLIGLYIKVVVLLNNRAKYRSCFQNSARLLAIVPFNNIPLLPDAVTKQ
jgi:hypothetical protein